MGGKRHILCGSKRRCVCECGVGEGRGVVCPYETGVGVYMLRQTQERGREVRPFILKWEITQRSRPLSPDGMKEAQPLEPSGVHVVLSSYDPHHVTIPLEWSMIR